MILEEQGYRRTDGGGLSLPWKTATPLYAMQVAQMPRLLVLACVVMMGKAAACYSVRAKQCRYSLAISGGNFSK